MSRSRNKIIAITMGDPCGIGPEVTASALSKGRACKGIEFIVIGNEDVLVAAGQEGIALSEETTRSARDIAQVTQQQRKATEQVGRSMDNMAATVTQATASTRQTAATAHDLVNAALRLDRLVGTSSVVAQTQRAPALAAPEDGGGAHEPRTE